MDATLTPIQEQILRFSWELAGFMWVGPYALTERGRKKKTLPPTEFYIWSYQNEYYCFIILTLKDALTIEKDKGEHMHDGKI